MVYVLSLWISLYSGTAPGTVDKYPDMLKFESREDCSNYAEGLSDKLTDVGLTVGKDFIYICEERKIN